MVIYNIQCRVIQLFCHIFRCSFVLYANSNANEIENIANAYWFLHSKLLKEIILHLGKLAQNVFQHNNADVMTFSSVLLMGKSNLFIDGSEFHFYYLFFLFISENNSISSSNDETKKKMNGKYQQSIKIN